MPLQKNLFLIQKLSVFDVKCMGKLVALLCSICRNKPHIGYINAQDEGRGNMFIEYFQQWQTTDRNISNLHSSIAKKWTTHYLRTGTENVVFLLRIDSAYTTGCL